MPFRVGVELRHTRDRRLYRRDGNALFLGQRVRQNCDLTSMKRVQDAVVDSRFVNAKLINPITQVISLWPTKFMSHLYESAHSHEALGERPSIAPLKVG